MFKTWICGGNFQIKIITLDKYQRALSLGYLVKISLILKETNVGLVGHAYSLVSWDVEAVGPQVWGLFFLVSLKQSWNIWWIHFTSAKQNKIETKILIL